MKLAEWRFDTAMTRADGLRRFGKEEEAATVEALSWITRDIIFSTCKYVLLHVVINYMQ